mgnify:CR=1 FL=1
MPPSATGRSHQGHRLGRRPSPYLASPPALAAASSRPSPPTQLDRLRPAMVGLNRGRLVALVGDSVRRCLVLVPAVQRGLCPNGLRLVHAGPVDLSLPRPDVPQNPGESRRPPT